MEEDHDKWHGTPSVQAVPQPHPSSSKKKYEDKHRKKDSKSWENVMKATAGLGDEEKMSFIEEKYEDLYCSVRQLTNANQKLIKQYATLEKECNHHQSELTKSIVARARLENLCRELQKQNKQIKEENMAKIKEEEERRKEVSLKFADKLSNINTMMDENKEKSEQLREENHKMTAKLAELYDQFQKREEDFTRMSHQLDLERQFSQATLVKMELEIQAEKEINAREQALLKSNLEKSEASRSVLIETVKGLQEQIDLYKHQYDNIETTMSKSAKVFDNFKNEIANMTKQLNSLEQETQSWKNKFNDSMKALIDMTELKKNQDLHLQSLERKNEQLHKLCRQLQVDRGNYLKQLKSNGIEPTPSQMGENEETKKAASPKMTKKEKELQLLKENLKAVQDELTRLSVEDTNKTDETNQETNVEETDVPKQEPAPNKDAPIESAKGSGEFVDIPLPDTAEDKSQAESTE